MRDIGSRHGHSHSRPEMVVIQSATIVMVFIVRMVKVIKVIVKMAIVEIAVCSRVLAVGLLVNLSVFHTFCILGLFRGKQV